MDSDIDDSIRFHGEIEFQNKLYYTTNLCCSFRLTFPQRYEFNVIYRGESKELILKVHKQTLLITGKMVDTFSLIFDICLLFKQEL